MAKGDVSKNVVAVLLVLAIIVSVVGTWLVLQGYDEVKIITGDDSGEGNVNLQIGPEQGITPQPSEDGGDVALEIQEPAAEAPAAEPTS